MGFTIWEWRIYNQNKCFFKSNERKTLGFNGYTVSGNIEVGYFDTYNWDPGKGDYVPGFGYTDDNDFNDLVENGEAANFNMTSGWNINVSDWGYVGGSVRASTVNAIMESR